MVSIGYRTLKYIDWLRRHRSMVVAVVACLEIIVAILDHNVNNDIPISQLHWVSIILAAIVFDVAGVVVVAISSTILFYVANYMTRGRELDWATVPGIILTLLLFALVGIAALVIIRLLASLERSNKELVDKLHQLQASTARIELLTAERERNRLARELHDGVAKTLFGVEYAAGALEKLLISEGKEESPQTKAAAQQARFIQEVCHNEGQSVRDIILDLRRGYEEPLFKLMGDYLQRWQLAYDQKVNFQVGGQDVHFEPSQAYEVMAILEEAMENIHRHSQARTVWVKAQIIQDKCLELEVRDNGIGLRGDMVEKLAEMGYPGALTGVKPLVDQTGRPHFGLTGMVERATWMDGKLELSAAPEGGLALKLDVPVRQL